MEQRGLEWEIPADRAPTQEQRQWFAQRVEAIESALRPASDTEIRMEVAALFATLGTRSADEGDTKAILAIYVADLKDLPGAAIKAACADFRQGKAGDGKWAPTQAQIRAQAITHLVAPRGEVIALRRILTAKVVEIKVNESYKAEVSRHVEETINILKAASERPWDTYKPPSKKEANDWLKSEEAHRPAPPISPAIRDSLNRG